MSATPVTHNLTPPYPSLQDFVSCAGIVVDKLRGQSVDLATLVHCGWVCAGYAASNVVPGASAMQLTASMSDESFADLLQDLRSQNLTFGSTENIAVPWSLIATTLFNLVLEWLKK